jgi:hypothetical protein
VAKDHANYASGELLPLVIEPFVVIARKVRFEGPDDGPAYGFDRWRSAVGSLELFDVRHDVGLDENCRLSVGSY